MPNPRVFMELDSRAASGRLIIELFADKVPRAAEKALCTGEKGRSRRDDSVELSYRGVPIHRVVAPEFLIQGGDVVTGTGNDGCSIYEEKEFEDENLGWCDLNEAGYVCMANHGPNTNSSQFFITLCPTPWLRNEQTAVGKVLDGMQWLPGLGEVVVDDDDRPVEGEEVLITRCGELKFRPKSEQNAAKSTMAGEKVPDRARDRDRHQDRHGERDRDEAGKRDPDRETSNDRKDRDRDSGRRGDYRRSDKHESRRDDREDRDAKDDRYRDRYHHSDERDRHKERARERERDRDKRDRDRQRDRRDHEWNRSREYRHQSRDRDWDRDRLGPPRTDGPAVILKGRGYMTFREGGDISNRNRRDNRQRDGRH